jgi:hypothetical protein
MFKKDQMQGDNLISLGLAHMWVSQAVIPNILGFSYVLSPITCGFRELWDPTSLDLVSCQAWKDAELTIFLAIFGHKTSFVFSCNP